MAVEDIREALVIRERATFLLTDPDGNVPPGNTRGFGIYQADTRHLSGYQFSLNGIAPVMLLSTAELGYAMEQVMTNPTLGTQEGRTVNRGTIEIRRQRVISEVTEERLSVTNYNPFPVSLSLLYEFAADFADIFDVRGYERERMGDPQEPLIDERSITYTYKGIDGRERRTRIEFDTKPDYIDSASVLFRVTLHRRESASLRLTIAIDDQQPSATHVSRFEMVAEDYRRWNTGSTQVFTDNELFNRVLGRSVDDVRMLWSASASGQPYPAAGTPWFDAFFGRDSCVLAMQMLPYRPDVARETLQLLAKWQGKRVDHSHDEEPGKILHELRFDELSRAGELPYGPYYGSIDSTPLFLMLLAEYYDWTNDLEFVRELLPAVKRALHWMNTYGDVMGDGYLASIKRSAKGLVNQGWKDSWDSVVHANGELAQAPVALAEVQGYAYAARRRMAPLLEALGEDDLAADLRERAARLREQFDRDFWLADQRFFAMALDGARRPVTSVTTNPAHGLWCGIIEPERAGQVVSRLMANDIFSGWGLRTLTASNPRYNPIGYHIGSVWPHDNSIAAMGFKMYGFEDELNEIGTALFDAAATFPYFRLPELFGGEARSAHNAPVPYPVACSPQSWAAGSIPLITQAILGLKAEASEKQLRIVNPRLPYWLGTAHVRNLRIGGGHVTLQYRRVGGNTHVEVQKTTGGIDVIISKQWPT